MTQKILRTHDDEGLAELAVHLTTQHVEVVCRRRDVANLPVGLLKLQSTIHRHVGNLTRIFVRHL